MSIVRRLWERILKPSYFVGKDLEGNKYFECPNTDKGRSKRTVKYRKNEDMWAYVASGRRLPVQWSAWLTHTRPIPPTIEELQADLARQQRVKINAAILEAKYQTESADRGRVAVPPSHNSEIEAQSPSASQNVPMDQKLEPQESDQRPKSQTRDPWAEASKGSDEPRSWTPVSRRR
ncbi:uncharacterized protein EDB91DRAFT_409925 [Suillus paluster]|uniref:uncharacterized protein n=1 Tax=Suillus paluster TaxID=48578 RepID=UPI001B864517|nr:uncharacterized protein EDB91DRAFT_409925 [Suillus paluster]KAG1753641.1 hypothetical protein EDB91DRAFT_409925 [Suillus paluster]